jgi:hypothetical protein
MGRPSPRLPLPPSATAAEMRADLEAYRAEIRATMRGTITIVVCSSVLVLVVMIGSIFY